MGFETTPGTYAMIHTQQTYLFILFYPFLPPLLFSFISNFFFDLIPQYFLVQAENRINRQFAIDFQYNWRLSISDQQYFPWVRDVVRLYKALKVVDSWDAEVSIEWVISSSSTPTSPSPWFFFVINKYVCMWTQKKIELVESTKLFIFVGFGSTIRMPTNMVAFGSENVLLQYQTQPFPTNKRTTWLVYFSTRPNQKSTRVGWVRVDMAIHHRIHRTHFRHLHDIHTFLKSIQVENLLYTLQFPILLQLCCYLQTHLSQIPQSKVSSWEWVHENYYLLEMYNLYWTIQ